MNIVALTLIATITGASLQAIPAASVLRLSTAPFSESGYRFEPLITEAPGMAEELAVRLDAGEAPAGGGGRIRLDLGRHAAGADRLLPLEAVEYRGGDAWVALVGEGKPFELAGTVTIAAGATAVAGTGTSFLRDCPPGSKLWTGGRRCEVDSVTSDTALTLTTGHAAAVTAATARVQPLYTLAHPLVLAHGRVEDWSLDHGEPFFAIAPRPTPTAKRFLQQYPGFGPGIYFDGGEKATTPSVIDPGGDFTITCRFFHFLERTAAIQRLMDCNTIDLRLNADHKLAGVIGTSTGSHSLTSPAAVPFEAVKYAALRWKSADALLEIVLDSEVVAENTTADGTLNAIADAFIFGARYTGTTHNLEGVANEFSIWGRYLDDDELLSMIGGPLAISGDLADDDDLLGYWPGEAGVSNDLFEAAEVNADAPNDATLAGSWKRAPVSPDAEELAGVNIPRGLGFCEHARCNSVMTDAPNDGEELYHIASGTAAADQTMGAIQHVRALYESGESKDLGGITGAPQIVVRANTYKDFLDASLSGATNNEAAVWHQGGMARLVSRSVGGDVTADFWGEGIGLRSMYFNGVDGIVNYGTSGNAVFTNSFVILLRGVRFKDLATVNQVLISNSTLSGPTYGFGVYLGTSGGPTYLNFFYQPNAASGNAAVTYGPLYDDRTYDIDLLFKYSAPDWDLGLFVDGALVDSASQTAIGAITTSPADLTAGDSADASYAAFNGYIGELAILSAAKDLDWHRTHLLGDVSTDADLAHHYPARSQDFPAVTVTDEAGSLDGTIGGGFEWRGPLTQTSVRGQVEQEAREDAGLDTSALDLAELYSAATDPVHLYMREDQEADLAGVLRGILESVGGWRRWTEPLPAALTGTWSVTAGTGAVTGSSTAALDEIALPALFLTEGEPLAVSVLTSDTALTLAEDHIAGATAAAALVFQPKLRFGFVQAPEGATLTATLPPEAVREIQVAYTRELPEVFRVSNRWIHHPGEELPATVAEWRRRLWADELRWKAQRSRRNRRLWAALAIQETDPQAPFEREGRFYSPAGARDQARVDRDLFGLRRVVAAALLYDPAGQVQPGRYFAVENADLPGGLVSFLVRSVIERDPLRQTAQVRLWGGTLESLLTQEAGEYFALEGGGVLTLET
ncbi:MAG: hypothetical protein GY719_25930 [bacterium]|nr:hypothetical protein [bacterium]